MFKQSLRMLVRDWRAGELRLLLVAVAIAVTALSSVGFFADRLSQALNGQARQLLGADAVLSTDAPAPESIISAAKSAGITVAQTVVFPSMLGATGEAAKNVAPQLSSIKAVSQGYPLRGALRIANDIGQAGEEVRTIPKSGYAWIDPQLLGLLQLKIGDKVELGDKQFIIEKLIVLEPDRGTNFVSFAPRVMINLDDLAATKLIQLASRVNYKTLFSAEPFTRVDAFVSAQKVGAGQRFEDARQGRPELRATLDRAERFLALVALLSALIAATAIALAARRFAQRHLDGVAVMRAMGATQRNIVQLLFLELLWVALAAAVVGIVLGFSAHYVLIAALKSLLAISLPTPNFLPGLQAGLAGVVLLLGFAGFPILRLGGVTPLRVLRRDLGTPAGGAWASIGIALVACLGLLVWFAGDLKIAGIALGGFIGAAALFAGFAWLLVKAVGLAGKAAPGSALGLFRVVLAGWAKRGNASIVQMVALGISLMALLLLTVTRNDLLESWQRASPKDAPNRFVINIQPDQKDAVANALAKADLKNVDLSPMIRGRVVKINDQPIQMDQYDERAKRTLDRELNLSYLRVEPSHNKTTSGRWIDPTQPEVSVEEGVAQSLKLSIGDSVTFDIAGEQLSAKVVGLRKVSWDSMKVNFFMILSPSVLEKQPQTYITALHVPPEKGRTIDSLVRSYPNLTVFDTDNIARQVQTVLNQVSRAVEFLFGFTLLAGILVLYAAQSAGQQDRQRETALMRALGASRQQLQSGLTAELLLTGGLAGLMGAIGAIAVGWLLARFVFEFAMPIAIWPIVVGVVAGASAALLAGWWGLRKIVQTPPMLSLRQEL